MSDSSVQSRNYTDAECQSHCHRDCRQIRFDVTHKTQGRLLRPDMTVVELQWGSFEYVSMKQDYVWTVTSFIAALGGSTGMWLGLSMLSLIQFSTYAATYVKQNWIEKTVRKRRGSVAPSPAAASYPDVHVLGDDEIKTRKLSNDADGDINSLDGFAAYPFSSPFKTKVRRSGL